MTLHSYCLKITQKIGKMPAELCRVHLSLWRLIKELNREDYRFDGHDIYTMLDEAEQKILDASSMLHEAYELAGEILIEGEELKEAYDEPCVCKGTAFTLLCDVCESNLKRERKNETS